jgi:hypothetical protein
MLAEIGVLALVKLIGTNLPSLRLSRTRAPNDKRLDGKN